MDSNNDQSRPWEKSNTLPHKLSGNSGGAQSGNASNGTTNNGSESPRPSRKRFGSASEETILKQVNGDGLSISSSHELEALKADILREVRIEINKATKEIIDGIYIDFYREKFKQQQNFIRITLNLCYFISYTHSYKGGIQSKVKMRIKWKCSKVMTAIDTIGRKREKKPNEKTKCPSPFNDKAKIVLHICLHLLLIINNLNRETILKKK